jgi:hypothetical protein
MAANQPDCVLGLEAAVWWSRDAQPQMPAWSADKPVRLGDKTVPAKDPAGTASAWDGREVPTAHHMRLRVVPGRPVSVVTCAFRAWPASYLTAPGQRALLRLWDPASGHVRQVVQAGITAHNRQATHEGGCRLSVCR